jgi:hypothetical protein
MSKEMREQINKVKSFSKFLNEDNKFPLTDDGRMGLNLEFKYKNRVYYIDTNKRTVKTEHYPDIEIKLPKRIILPNINTIEDNVGGKDFNIRISNLEQSLEVDNVKYKDLQEYLKSIDWEMENDKYNLENTLYDFINTYNEDELMKVISKLDVQFNKR